MIWPESELRGFEIAEGDDDGGLGAEGEGEDVFAVGKRVEELDLVGVLEFDGAVADVEGGVEDGFAGDEAGGKERVVAEALDDEGQGGGNL